MSGLSTLDELKTLGGATATVAEAAVGLGENKVTSGNILPTFASSRIVLIVLGLLLIAAGLFSFDRTREIVVQAGRAATAAAA